MQITELIEEAKAKDPKFKSKMDYWTSERTHKKKITLEWLMPKLEKILGTDYVQAAAQAQIDSQED